MEERPHPASSSITQPLGTERLPHCTELQNPLLGDHRLGLWLVARLPLKMCKPGELGSSHPRSFDQSCADPAAKGRDRRNGLALVAVVGGMVLPQIHVHAAPQNVALFGQSLCSCHQLIGHTRVRWTLHLIRREDPQGKGKGPCEGKGSTKPMNLIPTCLLWDCS